MTTTASAERPITTELNNVLSKEIRKEQGIYFTPTAIRNRLFEVIGRHISPSQSMRILEPSFGSGEFLYDARERYSSANIVGVEKNKTIFDKVAANFTGASVTLHNMDFLDFTESGFEVIIGNPPYFTTTIKNPACMSGRGNIFVLFIYNCLTKHLAANGILAFIIPTSFYNCLYYQACSDYIVNNTTILHVENMTGGGFYETEQNTTLLVVRKAAPKTVDWTFNLHGRTYISPNYKELTEIVAGATNLASLGFSVKTGDVVWNQEKKNLHETQGTLIIYANNIVNNNIVLNNFAKRGGVANEKKQRIKNYTREPVRGPAIVINRGYGNANYKLSYALIPATMEPFYGENHVNVITANNEEAKNNFTRILASLADPRTTRFLSMFSGNNALSKTELETMIPIF